MSTLIDVCIEYVEAKDCHYLAKEGQIVYFASITGRKSDYTWHKLSPTEVMRIIKATKLGADTAPQLKQEHLVAAFQELDRVYEFAVKTRHKVDSGIFNYSEHSNESMGDSIMSFICDELQQRNFTALYMSQVVTLFDMAQCKMEAGVSAKESRELLFKHFEAAGYEIRTGVRRVFINNRKTPAIMKPGTKPADVVKIPTTIAEKIVTKMWRELK